MFTAALSWGFQDQRLAATLLPFAMFVRLAFTCLLRNGELVNLRAQDVLIDRPKQVAILALSRVKAPLGFGQA